DGARIGGAPADRPAGEFGAVPRAASAPHPCLLEVTGVGPAACLELGDGGADVTVELAPLPRRERARGAGGVEPGSPQDLVRQQVAEPGDTLLVHEAGLERGGAGVERGDQLLIADRGGVRAEAFLFGVELDPAEPTGI